MSFMLAFGLASIMLSIGMILRTKVAFLRNMFVPASVIAGIIGMVVMNIGVINFTDASMFTSIVTNLFTLTFISIGLTGTKSTKSKSVGKEIARGSIGMGFVWNLLYALTPVVGGVVLLLIGGFFGMDAFYGMLVPFAFAQGPGQAATFGAIFESQYGIENAAMVGLTFAAIGFLACYFVGVPLAKYGLKKGLAKHSNTGNMAGYIQRGYYAKEDKKVSMGNETVYAGNMDTMTFHFAMMGISFMLALVLAKVVSFIPGIGATLSSMLFLFGMIAAYIVKFVLKKLGLDHMLDNTFQSKITGWATDYLVVASFMAVQFGIIGDWIIPILVVAVIVTIVSFIVVVYFGQRIGGDDDFGRTLGLYGTATGTVPNGISLLRIIDPSLKSNTPIELGLMNLPMIVSYVTVSTLFVIASGAVSITTGLLLLLLPIPVYLIILKVTKAWGKKTYDLKLGQTTETDVKAENYVS